MAQHKCIGIRQTLTTLLSKAEIERLAHESGAVRRRRKVDASAMLWTVLLGFGTGRERTLASLPRTYERVTGKSLVPSSFYDRFSKQLARMFRAVLRELMTKLAASEVRYGGDTPHLCSCLIIRFLPLRDFDTAPVMLSSQWARSRSHSTKAKRRILLVVPPTARRPPPASQRLP